MFRFMLEPASGSRIQCLAKITSFVPAYLLICFVASVMAAYSNLYTVCVPRCVSHMYTHNRLEYTTIALATKHINKYAGTIPVI